MCESILINNKEGRISTLRVYKQMQGVEWGEVVKEMREVSIVRIKYSFMKLKQPGREGREILS